MSTDETQNDEQREKADYCLIFSGCFKKMREEAELTQGELAEALGVSRQSVNAIEKGKSLPSIELAAGIAHYFETTIDAFFSLAHREIENEIERISNEDDILIENNNIHNRPRKQADGWKIISSSPSIHGTQKEDKMSLIPWRSSNILDDFDSVFDEDLFLPVRMPKNAMKSPQVNVYEKGNNVIVEAHLPGVRAEEVDIEVEDNFVTISGEKKEEKEDKDKNYYRKEVSYGSFSRTIPLSSRVVSDKAEAISKNGVLIITLPKKEVPKKKIVKIKVRSKK